MPNRILRDWTDSETVNTLSVHAERFFVRLIMKVDDYGNYPVSVKIIRASLFPLLLDEVRESDIERFLIELKEAGLVRFYEVESKKYVSVLNFKQRLDRAKSKYPLPSNDTEPLVNDTEPRAETKRSRNEVETEVEVEKKVQEILNSHSWIESVAMQLKQNFDVTVANLSDFLTELKLKEDLQKPIREIKSHFINWFKIQIEKKEKGSGKKEKTVESYLLKHEKVKQQIENEYASSTDQSV